MVTIKTYEPVMQTAVESSFSDCMKALGWDYQPHGRHSVILAIEETYMGYSALRADTQRGRAASRHLMEKYRFRQIERYNKNEFAELYYELDLSQYVPEECYHGFEL